MINFYSISTIKLNNQLWIKTCFIALAQILFGILFFIIIYFKMSGSSRAKGAPSEDGAFAGNIFVFDGHGGRRQDFGRHRDGALPLHRLRRAHHRQGQLNYFL